MLDWTQRTDDPNNGKVRRWVLRERIARRAVRRTGRLFRPVQFTYPDFLYESVVADERGP